MYSAAKPGAEFSNKALPVLSRLYRRFKSSNLKTIFWMILFLATKRCFASEAVDTDMTTEEIYYLVIVLLVLAFGAVCIWAILLNRQLANKNRQLGQKSEEKKRREMVTQLTQQCFHAVADCTHFWELWIGPTGRPLWTNPAARRVTGYSTKEIMSMPNFPGRLIYEEDRRRIEHAFTSALRGSSGKELQGRLIKKDGSIIWVEISWQSVYDENKELQGFHASVNDITERKIAQQLLTKERSVAQKYLDLTSNIFVIIDKEQKVTLLNTKGCELLGYDLAEIIGKNWFENFIPEKQREDVKAVFEKLMAGEIEPAEHYTNEILTKSGQLRAIAWHNTVLKDENGNPSATLSSGVDLTKSDDFTAKPD